MDILARSLVTAAALTLLVFRLGLIHSGVDSVNVGLLLIALLPWVAKLVESVLSAGRWETQFQELRSEQQRHKEELARLRFLTAHHVTENERDYLKKLAHGESFVHDADSLPSHFDTELRRLLAAGLIEALPGKDIDSLRAVTDEVSNHFRITDRGRAYVNLREELEQEDKPSAVG